jgi:hypothetical protein
MSSTCSESNFLSLAFSFSSASLELSHYGWLYVFCSGSPQFHFRAIMGFRSDIKLMLLLGD